VGRPSGVDEAAHDALEHPIHHLRL